jgi:hypothetical protein
VSQLQPSERGSSAVCSASVVLMTFFSFSKWVLPEVAAQGALTVLLLLTGNWLEVVLNLPLLAWHIKL